MSPQMWLVRLRNDTEIEGGLRHMTTRRFLRCHRQGGPVSGQHLSRPSLATYDGSTKTRTDPGRRVRIPHTCTLSTARTPRPQVPP